MNKSQLRKRMRDMLLGAQAGYAFDDEDSPMAAMEPKSFFGWVQAVLEEFVPANSWLWKPRELHVFSDFSEAVDAVWSVMDGEKAE